MAKDDMRWFPHARQTRVARKRPHGGVLLVACLVLGLLVLAGHGSYGHQRPDAAFHAAHVEVAAGARALVAHPATPHHDPAHTHGLSHDVGECPYCSNGRTLSVVSSHLSPQPTVVMARPHAYAGGYQNALYLTALHSRAPPLSRI